MQARYPPRASPTVSSSNFVCDSSPLDAPHGMSAFAVPECRAAPFDDFVGAMKKVSILLGNLIDHPDDPKYKRVRTGNAALQRALFKFDGGMDAIRYDPASPHNSHIR